MILSINCHKYKLHFYFLLKPENNRLSRLNAKNTHQTLPIVKPDRKTSHWRFAHVILETRVIQKPSTGVDVVRQTGGKTHGNERGVRVERFRVRFAVEPRVVAASRLGFRPERYRPRAVRRREWRRRTSMRVTAPRLRL